VVSARISRRELFTGALAAPFLVAARTASAAVDLRHADGARARLEPVATYRASSSISDVNLSPAGESIALSVHPLELNLLSSAALRSTRTVQRTPSLNRGFGFLAGGRSIAVALDGVPGSTQSNQAFARVLDVESGSQISFLEISTGEIPRGTPQFRISPDGVWAVLQSGTTWLRHDLRSGTTFPIPDATPPARPGLRAGYGRVHAIGTKNWAALETEPDWFGVSGIDIVDLAAGRRVQRFHSLWGRFQSSAWTADGAHVALAGEPGNFSADRITGEFAQRRETDPVSVWDAVAGLQTWRMPPVVAHVWRVALSPDTRWLVASLPTDPTARTADRSIAIFEIPSGRRAFHAPLGRVDGTPLVAFSHDGRRLYWSEGNTLKAFAFST
jgi:hypothetical protein